MNNPPDFIRQFRRGHFEDGFSAEIACVQPPPFLRKKKKKKKKKKKNGEGFPWAKGRLVTG